MHYTKDEIILAYETFKLQWMIDHGYTIKNLIDSLANNMDDSQEPLIETFWMWEQDSGFGGSIWPCFDEWLDYEGNCYKDDWNKLN